MALQRRTLVGTLTGLEERRRYGLDEEDLRRGAVIITFEPEVLTVTSSFVRGFLGDSVERLGLDRFKQKYIIDATPHIKREFEFTIERIHNNKLGRRGN